MEPTVSSEQEALLQKEVSIDRKKPTEKQQQRQAALHKMSGGEDKHLVSESMDETISVGKFQLTGGAVTHDDSEALTPSGDESPRQGVIDTDGIPNDTVQTNDEGSENKAVLLPELDINIFLRDQTVLHVNLEEGQHATAADLIEVVMTEQKLPDEARNIFCLWLVSPLLELRLKPHHKPFYLVQQWADLCDRYTEEDADDIAKDEPMLMFQRDVFYPREPEKSVTDKEVLLYLYQEAKFNVLEGRYIVSMDDFYALAGLSAFVHLGHFDRKSHITPFYRSCLESFFPDCLFKKKWSLTGLWSKNSGDELVTHLENHHSRVSDRYHNQELSDALPKVYREYLNILYTYPFYGGAFFSGDIDRTSKLQFLRGFQDKPVWISINTEGVTLIDREKNEMLLAIPFETFSWRYKEAKKMDDPPILYLQFVCEESGSDTKLLVIDSYQAKLMDALIETCVQMKIEKYNTPGDCVDAPSPSSSSSSSMDPFKKCVNKLDRLCLETLTPEGDRVV